jgi:hypothetical protein
MSTRKIITTILILSIFAIALFIYPSMNQSVRAEQIKFSGHNNQMMTLQDVTSLTKIYRINTESTAMLIQYFGKDAVEKALAQPGCVKVHVYYGKNQDGKSGFMIFGVDNKGNETIASLIPTCLGCNKVNETIASMLPVCPKCGI